MSGPTRRVLVPEDRALRESGRRYRYSPALAVGDLVFVSGLVGRRDDGTVPETVTEQTHCVMEQLRQLLAQAGGSLIDLVQVTSFHLDLAEIDEFAAARADYLDPVAPPAWTALGTAGIALPGARFEVQAIAVLDR